MEIRLEPEVYLCCEWGTKFGDSGKGKKGIEGRVLKITKVRIQKGQNQSVQNPWELSRERAWQPRPGIYRGFSPSGQTFWF